MTDSNETFTPTDMRRAAALLTHYGVGDMEGVAEIWREAAESDTWPDLAGAIAALFFDLSPELRTSEGHRRLQELVRAYRAAEVADQDEGEP
jgi:hypothetical protein